MMLEFHTLDVFTETAFAGNPLAVVLGAEGLTAVRIKGSAVPISSGQIRRP